jgi:hypothetical protein
MDGDDMSDEQQTTTLVTELETEDGDAVSVQAAANSMLAIDSFISEINKKFARDRRIVHRLRPFAKGSFEIVLELIAMAAPLLGDSPWLAKIFSTLKEFFAIRRQIAGRNYTIKGENVVVVSGGERIEASPVTITFLNPKNPGAKAVEKAFGALGDDPSISEIKFRRGESEPFSRVPRQEFAYYGLPETMEETRDKPVRALVGIRQPAFASDLKWRLIWNGEKITATMEDEYFLERAISGGEIFCQKDRLDVTLVLKQERDPQSGRWINMITGHVIKKVWEHIRPDEQMNLEKDFANG